MLLNIFNDQFFLGILASLIASIIFLFIILIFLAPSIKISGFIVKRPGIPERDEPDNVYVFKIVNMSYFKCFDVNLELFRLERLPLGNNRWDTRYKKMTLFQGSLKFVPGYWYFGDVNSSGGFAMLVKTYENLEGFIDDDHVFLQLQVTARHGLTGLSRVFKKDFASAHECIKTGKHKQGRELGMR